MSKLRVAVIGCGGRGRGHMKILSEFDDTDLVAVCDPVEAARDNAADMFNVPTRYESIEALLDNEALDAIFVATPAHLNGEAALPCFERGVHTLLEKPPGMSVTETVALRSAAERTGAKGMVGWNRRFHPIIVEAKRQVTARGPVTQIVGEFHKSITRLAQSSKFPEHLMDNMFLETPIHALDAIRAIAEADVKRSIVSFSGQSQITKMSTRHSFCLITVVSPNILPTTPRTRALSVMRFTAETSPPILRESPVEPFSAMARNTKSPKQAPAVLWSKIGISWIVSNPILPFRSLLLTLTRLLKPCNSPKQSSVDCAD